MTIHLLAYIEKILNHFKSCFSRYSAFKWFVVIIINEKPPEKKPARGRPAKKGSAVKLKELLILMTMMISKKVFTLFNSFSSPSVCHANLHWHGLFFSFKKRSTFLLNEKATVSVALNLFYISYS